MPAFKVWAPRLVLLLVLMATVHSSIDPDHDRHTFSIYLGELQHAVYAFILTLALLLSFPTLRTAAAGGWVIAAGLTVELMQAMSILPGRPHPMDIIADMAGVAAAVVPIAIGAVRAKRRAEVLAQEEAPRRRSRRAPIQVAARHPDPLPEAA